MTKNIIKQSMSVLLAVSMAFTALTGIPATEAQAATAKPVIKCSKVKIKNNSCTIKVGQKVNLTAKSGKTNVTKKGTWKSSKKTVATISKAGKLTAKKAGTTNITITYKKKTSAKLKVVVKKKATATPTPNPVESSKPDVTSSPTTTSKPVPGAHTITYNPNGGTLSGSNTQSVTGEILEFPKVKAPSGKKFIGWYDKKSGGNRIYETYVPTKAAELFAHYVDDDKKTATVNFVTGCNYGGTYSFMGGGANHIHDYDWLNKRDVCGPLVFGDASNVTWNSEFTLDNSNNITFDNLPTPQIPGYTFEGWYTTNQNYLQTAKDRGTEIKVGDKHNIDPEYGMFTLYARFSKKLTISFDDFRGGKYDDIVIDTCKTIADSGAELPVPEVPGATFRGWTMDANNHDMWSMPFVKEDSMFSNCIQWYSYRCSGCDALEKHFGGPGEDCKPDCTVHFNSWLEGYYTYEETDHITLYPSYTYDFFKVTFDPTGGYFNIYDESNMSLHFDNDADFYGNNTGVGSINNSVGSYPFGHDTLPTIEGSELPKGSYGSGNHVPVVKRSYYELDGWYYKDDNGEEQEFTEKTRIPHELDVYAKWKPGKSRILFGPLSNMGGFISDEEKASVGLDSAGSYEVTTESSASAEGKRFPIPENRDGRKFLGWVTEDDEPFTEDMPVIGAVRIYAQWGSLPKDLPIKLDFDPNGGTFDDETFENNISGNRGTSFNTFPSVSRDDYDFLGWYVLKPGATDYNDDASFIQMVGKTLSIKNEMVDDLGDDDDDNDKVTLVARWQPKGHAQSINMSVYDRSTYELNAIENDVLFNIQYDADRNLFPYWFRGSVMPETIDNRNIIWTSSNPDVVYLSGADANGEYVTKTGATLSNLNFAQNLVPTKEGYDVTLTARSADVASVTFTIQLHVYFPEDQIPVTVTFDAGTYGKFDDNGKRYQSKVYDVKRSKNLMSIIGSETPVLDFENTDCFDSHGAAKYEFIGWEVITANGDVIDVTDDMKASDFNGLDEIDIVAA